MPSSFKGAEQSVDVQKRALLASIAQQGQAGRAQHEAQQKAAGEVQKAAVAGAAQRAGAAGAPDALAKQLAGSAEGVTDVYAADAQRAGAAHGQEMARMQGANANYMDQVSAAVPLARTVTEGKVNIIKAEHEERARERAHAAAERAEQQRYREEERNFARERQSWAREDRAAALAEQAEGKPMAPLDFNKAAAVGGLTPQQAEGVRNSVAYKTMAPKVAEFVADGLTREQIMAKFRGAEAEFGRPLPLTWQVIDAMFYGTEGAPQQAAPSGPSAEESRIAAARAARERNAAQNPGRTAWAQQGAKPPEVTWTR